MHGSGADADSHGGGSLNRGRGLDLFCLYGGSPGSGRFLSAVSETESEADDHQGGPGGGGLFLDFPGGLRCAALLFQRLFQQLCGLLF